MGSRGHFKSVTHDFWILERTNIRFLPKKTTLEKATHTGIDFHTTGPVLLWSFESQSKQEMLSILTILTTKLPQLSKNRHKIASKH